MLLNTEIKNVKLKNGIELLLLKDVKSNKSSFSLDIGSGSLNDPANAQGLSHLLEHVLFTTPSSNSIYSNYFHFITTNQGFFNATTGLEHTNFRFEIDHDVFFEAIKILSEFFLYPKFDEHKIFNEKKVIDSEFAGIVNEDKTRLQRLFFYTCDKNHKITQMHHGNMQTLNNVTISDLTFFMKNNYTANLFKIAVYTKHDLNKLEDELSKCFSDYLNINKIDEKINSSIFETANLPELIFFKTLNNKIFMKLSFQTPSLYKMWRSKPHWVLTYLLNFNGKGSLYTYLKQKNYVTDIYASTNNYSFASFFNIDIELTNDGLNNYEKVIEAVFLYIELIKNKGYETFLFTEQKNISMFAFLNSEQAEGHNYIKNISKNMHYYPAEKVFDRVNLIFEHSKSDFYTLLNCLSPDKAKIILGSPNFSGDKIEPFYNINYSLNTFEATFLSKLNSNDIQQSFTYPRKNIFLPDIKKNKKIKFDNINYPHKVLDDKRGVVWFLQDKSQNNFMAQINVLLITDLVNKDPVSKLLSVFYSRLVEEALTDISDYAGYAGLSFGIDRDDRGISFFVVGYSQKIMILAKKIIDAFTIRIFEEKTFYSVKQKLISDYDELKNADAYQKAQYLKYDLIHKFNINRNLYSDVIKNIKQQNLQDFVANLLKNINIEIFSYGSLQAKDLLDYVDYIYKKLQAECLEKQKIPKDVIIYYDKPYAFFLNSDSSDSCWATYINFGVRSTKLSAIIQTGMVFLSAAFFDEFRVKNNLGYVVESRLDFFEEYLGVSFTILSERYDSVYISENANSFFVNYIDNVMSSISKTQFDSAKSSLINKIKKNNRTLDDWMSEIILTSVLKGDILYGEKLSEEIQALSLQEIIETFKKAFNPFSRSSISVYVSSESDKKIPEYENLITDTLFKFEK